MRLSDFGGTGLARCSRQRSERTGVAHLRRFPQWRWHLDEVFVKINGKLCYLWRAVDHEGEVLETVVTAKRDKAAALKFLKRIMKKYGQPRIVVTPVPQQLSRWVRLPGEDVRLARLEDVIAANVEGLFPGAAVAAAALFRITRDADVSIEQVEKLGKYMRPLSRRKPDNRLRKLFRFRLARNSVIHAPGQTAVAFRHAIRFRQIEKRVIQKNWTYC